MLTTDEARLVAERDGWPSIQFPPELMARANEPLVSQAISSEQTIFDNWKASISRQTEILNGKKAEDARAIHDFFNPKSPRTIRRLPFFKARKMRCQKRAGKYPKPHQSFSIFSAR